METDIMGIAKEFVNWTKEQGIKQLDKVQYDHVRNFLLSKVEYCSMKTLKVNASALRKFFNTIGESGHLCTDQGGILGNLFSRKVSQQGFSFCSP